MTETMIDLPGVIAKSDDADFLRELIQDAAQRLAADTIRCFSEHNQRLAHRVVIDPPLGPRPRRRPQHPRGMLAVVARHRGELAQDATTLSPPGTLVGSAPSAPPAAHLSSPCSPASPPPPEPRHSATVLLRQ